MTAPRRPGAQFGGRPRSTEPRCTEMIKILVAPELDSAVKAAAKREGRSVSDWGRRLFERAVSGEPPKGRVCR